MKTSSRNHTTIWFFLSMFLILAGITILLLLLVSPAAGVSAHTGDPFASGCGMAVMDGIVSQGEWNSAAIQTFQMVSPGGAQPFTATLYVMNSATNLFLGITINDDEFSTSAIWLPRGDGFRIDFDNDNTGALFAMDDDVLTISAGTPQFTDAYIYNLEVHSAQADPLGGGTADGAGAANRLEDLNHFELKHPLCSGDALDFCLQPGEIVGFRLEYLDAQANGAFGGSQLFPGSGVTSEADIVIGQCSIFEQNLFLPLAIR